MALIFLSGTNESRSAPTSLKDCGVPEAIDSLAAMRADPWKLSALGAAPAGTGGIFNGSLSSAGPT
jgi:hypothetical protein